MISVSSGFRRAATTSHVAKFKVELREADGSFVEDLTDSLIGGSVTIDATATYRSQLSLTLSQEAIGWTGGTYGDIAASYASSNKSRTYGQLAGTSKGRLTPQGGHEIHVWRGIVVSGSTEWVKLGVFHIASVSSSATSSSTISIVGYDRARLVSLNRWNFTQTATGLSQAHVLFGNLVKLLLPSRDIQVVGASETPTPLPNEYVFEIGNNPWEDMTRAAATYGLEMYFNQLGQLVIDETNRTLGTPVWAFRSGTNGTLIERQMDQDDDGVCSAVLVMTNDGVIALAEDENPNSWTYAKGPFGRRFHVENTDQKLTTEQALLLARRILVEKQTLIQEVTVDSVPMPAIEPGDTVRLYDSTGINALYRVVAVTIPLDLTTPMTTVVRKG